MSESEKSHKSILPRPGRPSAVNNPKKEWKNLGDIPEIKRLTIDLDIERHKKVKTYAAQQYKTIAEIIRDMIDKLEL
jgi:hypothetical protein